MAQREVQPKTKTTRAQKFAMLMGMTTSSNDGEALIALRKANAMLAEDKVSWADLLDALTKDQEAQVPVSAPPPPRPEPEEDEAPERYYNAAEINTLFANLRKVRRNIESPGVLRFIDDVERFWRNRRYLTYPQYEGLKRTLLRAEIRRSA